MNKDIYPFLNLEEDFIYLFVSKGSHGAIDKIVSISPLSDDLGKNFSPLYNLSFGDLNGFDGKWKIDSARRSGNGDMAKIIATVAKIAIDFLERHREVTLSFKGYIDQKSASEGRNQRNILYQRSINSNWTELSARFDFWGIKAGNIEKYIVGMQYDQILVKYK